MEYKYQILPGLSELRCNKGTYDELFVSWQKVWNEVFNPIAPTGVLNLDDFYKQKYFAVLRKDKELVGMHCYSLYNLEFEACKSQSYFSSLPDSVIQFLKQRKMNRIMTMEYLTIFPEFRKKYEEYRWAEVIIGLGTKILQKTNADYALGTARQDVKVNQMGQRCLFETTAMTINKYDYPCEVMFYNRDTQGNHLEIKYQNLINLLWSERMDDSGLTVENYPQAI